MPLKKTKSGLTFGLPPESLQPHLIVKLKKEWRYKKAKGVFLDISGKRKAPAVPPLPAGVRVVPMVPALAETDTRKLAKDELTLARFVYIVLPAGTTPERFLKEVLGWHFVESAELPPSVSLP
jgi:hypothetical protein